MLIAHRIALNPTPVQEDYFRRAAGVARFAYNWALEENQRQYEAWRADPSLPRPNILEIKKRLNAVKREQFPWMMDVTKCAAQEGVLNVGRALDNFFRRLRAGERKVGYPRFKRREGREKFCAADEPGRFQVRDKSIRLPVIGWIRMRERLRFAGTPKRVTVSREGGRWFASIMVDAPDSPQCRQPGEVIGVDLGVKTLATLSNGERVEGPKAAKKAQKQLRRADKSLSRKQRGSSNWRKAKDRLSRVHARAANVRRDATHKLTTRLTKGWRVVCIEDLNVRGMMRNRFLSRALGDSALGEVRRQIEYKAKMYGAYVVVADRWYPSSKTCSCCGSVKAELALSQRTYHCERCGVEIDRDLNAARNLEGLAGSSPVTACGAVSSGRLSDEPVKLIVTKQESGHDALLVRSGLSRCV